MKKTFVSVSLALIFTVVLSTAAMSEEKKGPYTSFEQKFGYAIGVEVGMTLKSNSLELDLDALIQGITDGYNDNEKALNPEEIQTIKDQAIKKIREKAQAKRIKDASDNLKKGEEFLAENKKNEGVKSTDSGIQYIIMEEGKGDSPKVDDTVKVHYAGTLIDGTEFDSSYKRLQPASFPVNGVIKGWTEVLQMMKPGAKWKVFIPSDLAYGEKGAAGGAIGPNETLIFEINLIEVLPKEEAEKK